MTATLAREKKIDVVRIFATHAGLDARKKLMNPLSWVTKARSGPLRMFASPSGRVDGYPRGREAYSW